MTFAILICQSLDECDEVLRLRAKTSQHKGLSSDATRGCRQGEDRSYKVILSGVGELLFGRISQSRVWKSRQQGHSHGLGRLDAIREAAQGPKMRCTDQDSASL